MYLATYICIEKNYFPGSSSGEIPTVLNFLREGTDFSFLKAAEVFPALWYFGHWFIYTFSIFLDLGSFGTVTANPPAFKNSLHLQSCNPLTHKQRFRSQQISNEWWHVTDLWTPSLSLGWINPSDSLLQYHYVMLTVKCNVSSSKSVCIHTCVFSLLRRCKDCIYFCIYFYLKHLKPLMQNLHHPECMWHRPYLL